MSRVNEGQWANLNIQPLNRNGNAYTPVTARYRIDDKSSGNSVLAWTTIASADISSNMDVQIDATYNTIVNNSKPSEVKVVTVELDYSTATASTQVIEYEVVNLTFIS